MARPIRNNVDYFPHSVTHGKKMSYIEKKYGNDGYSTWFKILEELGGADNHYLDLNDEIQIMFLSDRCLVTEELLLSIIEDLVKLKEFDKELWQDKILFNEKFVNYISDAYKKRSNNCIDKNSLIILLGIPKPSKGIPKPSKGIPKPSKGILEVPVNTQSKVKESKVKESKVKKGVSNETNKETLFSLKDLSVKEKNKEARANEILEAEILEYSFDEFWEIYPNKASKKKAEEKFNKLSKSDKDKIEQHLPMFISNPPFKDYSFPHAATYLHQERFKDEIQINTKINNDERKQQYEAIGDIATRWKESNG